MPKKNFSFGKISRNYIIGGIGLVIVTTLVVLKFVLPKMLVSLEQQPALARVPVPSRHPTSVKYITNSTTKEITNDLIKMSWNGTIANVSTRGVLLGTYGVPPHMVVDDKNNTLDKENTTNTNTVVIAIEYPLNGDKHYQISMDINTKNGERGVYFKYPADVRIIAWDTPFYTDDLKPIVGSNNNVIGVPAGTNHNYTFNVKKPTLKYFQLHFQLPNSTDKFLVNNISITQLD